MQSKSWELCADFLKMEREIEEAGAKTEQEKAKFKNPYGKLQINYE